VAGGGGAWMKVGWRKGWRTMGRRKWGGGMRKSMQSPTIRPY